ncbi:Type-1 fimbrial protein, A chain precursor [compost metagenome]
MSFYPHLLPRPSRLDNPPMNAAFRPALLPALLLTCLPLFHAQTAHAVSGCAVENGAGPAIFTADFMNVWVPKDLPVGEPIANRRFTFLTDPSSTRVSCVNDGNLLEANVKNTSPFIHNIQPRLAGGRFANKVVRTSVNGIGAIVELGFPFSGGFPNTFSSVSGDNTVPYTGTNRATTLTPILIGPIHSTITLIKTGPITPGLNALDEELAHGSTTDVPDAFRLRVNANVNQAQCTLKSDAVSADPVKLGDYTMADFPAKDTTTASIPFQITLSDCEDDPASSTATAHIYLTGADGSVAIDPRQGLFSLGRGSTAKGIAIQITDDSGQPVPLEEHASTHKKLELPLTRLSYRAHFYQTDDKVTPGMAKGALDFTISYR